MTRFIWVAALAAIGLFSFAATTRAADKTVPNNSTTQNAAENPGGTHSANQAERNATVRPWRASETLGLKVEDPQGKRLGKIEDLVFNPHSGHIRYAVLKFGGVLGVGDKYFAIPWNHFRAEEKAGLSGAERFVLVLDVNESTLKNAPGFDSKNWPDFGDQAYGKSVDEFYGNNKSAHRSTGTQTK